MIEKGWTHDELSVMNEDEFSFWCDEAVALEEAKAEAVRKSADNK